MQNTVQALERRSIFNHHDCSSVDKKKCLKINKMIACDAESLIAYDKHIQYRVEKGIVGYALNHKCTDVEIQRAQGAVMDS